MDGARLDFDAPVLSVRRFSTPPEEKKKTKKIIDDKPPAPRRRSSLPFYKPDFKSGPVAKPGIVPFRWEQSPGRPKPGPAAVSVRTRPNPPPGRAAAAAVEDPGSPPFAADPELEQRFPALSPPINGGEASGSVDRPAKELEEEEEGAEEDEEEEEEEDEFTDAAETLSRADSLLMNCSITGLSGFTLPPPAGELPSRDFMLGRFLPAAQAIASSPQCGPRKHSPATRRAPPRPAEGSEEIGIGRRRQLGPPSYQERLNAITRHYDYDLEAAGRSCSEDDEEDDEELDVGNGRRHLQSKACGFLPRMCLKVPLLLLNPVPGVKPRGGGGGGRRPTPRSPRIKSSSSGSVGQVEDEYSWEAVYMQKLGFGDRNRLVGDGSNVANGSKHVAHRIDSQDGSSFSSGNSAPSRVSPYGNEAPRSPFHEGKGFLGVPKKMSWEGNASDSQEKDGESCSELSPEDVAGLEGSGSASPAVDRTLDMDSIFMRETPNSKSSSSGTIADTHGAMSPKDKDSEGGAESRRIEVCNNIGRTDEFPPKVQVCDGESKHKRIDCGQHCLEIQEPVVAKNGTRPSKRIVPPPLPNSPSESWLLRTLPSVSLKNRFQHSFGIQTQATKNASRETATGPEMESGATPSKAHDRRTRFAGS